MERMRYCPAHGVKFHAQDDCHGCIQDAMDYDYDDPANWLDDRW